MDPSAFLQQMAPQQPGMQPQGTNPDGSHNNNNNNNPSGGGVMNPAMGALGGMGGAGGFNASQLSALQGLVGQGQGGGGGLPNNGSNNMLAQLQQQQQHGGGGGGGAPADNGNNNAAAGGSTNTLDHPGASSQQQQMNAADGGGDNNTAEQQQQQQQQQQMNQQQQLLQQHLLQAQQQQQQQQGGGAPGPNSAMNFNPQDRQQLQQQPQPGQPQQQQPGDSNLQQQQPPQPGGVGGPATMPGQQPPPQDAAQMMQQQQQLGGGGGGMMGGMNHQNALLSAAAMGSGNMGFNLQQIQQLQLAQQLMAAGLPPNIVFQQQQNPLMAAAMGGPAAAGNPMMMNPFGAFQPPNQVAAAANNPMAAAGLNPMGGGGMGPNATAPNGMTGFLNAPGGGAAAVAGGTTNPLMTAGLAGGGKAGGKTAASQQQDWAEPFAGKGKKEPPFPLKLHQILSNPEFQECICWNPHGRSWRILKPPVFEQLVIPLYFRHAKYASFMRQVNGWGFKRIVSGNDHNSYFHELFLRDYPQLCLKMKRIRKGEKPATVEGEGSDGDAENGGAEVPEVIDGKGASLGGGDKEKGDDENNGDKEASGGEAKKVDVPSMIGVPPSMTNGIGAPTDASAMSGGPGYGLAALQGQLQGNALPGGASTTNAAQMPNPPMNLPGLGGGGGMAAPAPVSTAPSGLDNSSALQKLQEALQQGGGLQPQPQPPQQSVAPAPGFNFNNLNFLQGPLGGALAAQLQAATQAPSRPNDGNDSGGQMNGGLQLSGNNGGGQQQQQETPAAPAEQQTNA